MKKILFLILLGISQVFFAQEDCITAIPVCGNSGITYLPSGTGTVQEATGPNGGCLSGEHHSAWYTFTIQTAGTLTFLITPNGNIDYDWAVYGPNLTCANLGAPIRCSYDAPGPYATGLSLTATNTTDPAGGTGFCQYLDVLPGQTYYLLVDNFSTTVTQFTLTWGGTATLASPFNEPSLTPNPFIAPGPNHDGIITICGSSQLFDFSTLSAGIINGNPNFHVTYYSSSNNALTETSPITTPVSVNAGSTYYYNIQYTDPTNPNNPINHCKNTGTIKFIQGATTGTNVTLNACNNNNSGVGVFNLTTANVYPSGTIASTQYYPTLADLNANTNQITNPTAYQSAAGQVYAQVLTTTGCTASAIITLQFYPLLVVNTGNVTACNNNNSGVGIFNLTTANLTSGTVTGIKYYPTLANLNANTNEITNPTTYQSAPGTVYALLTNTQGCTIPAPIILQFYPDLVVNDASLTSCFIEGNFNNAIFDLTTANVTTVTPVVKTFYTTLTDAVNGTNSISNPTNYLSIAKVVYVRITNATQCWKVAKITLNITPPSYSTILKDKIICVENNTTLDAGTGYSAYLWSTGATTQTISNVGVGSYWVDLTKNGCVTHQIVHVIASPIPVLTNIDIVNNTVTLTVSGGTPPYLYSLDNVNWQSSNVFTGVPRGNNIIYIKDFYNCTAVSTEITVPNLVNAITPNGDGINDYVDYRALSNKKNLVFTVYDRYGNKLYTADKNNSYLWDGTSSGKRILTATYWYTITWNEPKDNSEVKYSGWILVKNKN